MEGSNSGVAQNTSSWCCRLFHWTALILCVNICLTNLVREHNIHLWWREGRSYWKNTAVKWTILNHNLHKVIGWFLPICITTTINFWFRVALFLFRWHLFFTLYHFLSLMLNPGESEIRLSATIHSSFPGSSFFFHGFHCYLFIMLI